MWTMRLLKGLKEVCLMNVIFVVGNDLVYRTIHETPAKFMGLFIK
jgi:hypothetical protein